MAAFPESKHYNVPIYSVRMDLSPVSGYYYSLYTEIVVYKNVITFFMQQLAFILIIMHHRAEEIITGGRCKEAASYSLLLIFDFYLFSSTIFEFLSIILELLVSFSNRNHSFN